jgi:hypothetical protein
MSDLTSWKQSIQAEMDVHGETFDDVVYCTLTEEELMVEFNGEYGGSEGEPFTLWTTNRVYFPVVYDSDEWVESVSRNPDGKPTYHFGGQFGEL